MINFNIGHQHAIVCTCTILQPGATVDVNDLTPEQAENSVTIVFGGVTVRLVAPLNHYCI